MSTNEPKVIETNSAGSVRLVREASGTYAVERYAVGRWFPVLRDPKPFFANDAETSPLEAARKAYRDVTASVEDLGKA